LNLLASLVIAGVARRIAVFVAAGKSAAELHHAVVKLSLDRYSFKRSSF
jgi:hypothetical protein